MTILIDEEIKTPLILHDKYTMKMATQFKLGPVSIRA